MKCDSKTRDIRPGNLISLNNFSNSDALWIIDRANELASSNTKPEKILKNRNIGLFFELTSTRTRSSFQLAAQELGANVIFYDKLDLQINTGESFSDTFKVLGHYLDQVIIRSDLNNLELDKLSEVGNIGIINAMSPDEHPTQALSDFSFMKYHFGRLNDLNLLYLGEGNSTAIALALLAANLGNVNITLSMPARYGISNQIVMQTLTKASNVRIINSIPEHTEKYDVIYTTKWATTGTSKPDLNWKDDFLPFKVTSKLLDTYLRSEKSIFMHDLPSIRGEDTEEIILDSERCAAFKQARHKLFTALAVLEYSFTL